MLYRAESYKITARRRNAPKKKTPQKTHCNSDIKPGTTEKLHLLKKSQHMVFCVNFTMFPVMIFFLRHFVAFCFSRVCSNPQSSVQEFGLVVCYSSIIKGQLTVVVDTRSLFTAPVLSRSQCIKPVKPVINSASLMLVVLLVCRFFNPHPTSNILKYYAIIIRSR